MFFEFNKEKIKQFVIVGLLIWFVSKIASGGLGDILQYLYVIPGLLIAIGVHEFSHAYVAYKLGDNTPKYQGRLTLNPLKHVDPVGMLSLFLLGFGWGRPVEYNPNNLHLTRDELEKAEAKIALAGPVSNFVTAFIFALILNILTLIFPGISKIIITLFVVTVQINIGLGVFNLIPVPPLDGYKIFYRFMKGRITQWIENNSMIIQFAFLISIFTGLITYVLVPLNQIISKYIIYAASLFGLIG